MRVDERRRELRLAQEPLAEALVVRELGREQLERNAPPLAVLGQVDLAHRAAPERLPDAEAADHGAGRAIGGSSPITLPEPPAYLKTGPDGNRDKRLGRLYIPIA